MANSDPYLLKFFLKFLYGCFEIKRKEIRLSLQCYPDNKFSISKIKKFWLKQLNLTEKNLNPVQINHRPISSIHHGKGRRLDYGMARITISRTDIVQKILGAIQEMGKFSKTEWLG